MVVTSTVASHMLLATYFSTDSLGTWFVIDKWSTVKVGVGNGDPISGEIMYPQNTRSPRAESWRNRTQTVATDLADKQHAYFGETAGVCATVWESA